MDKERKHSQEMSQPFQECRQLFQEQSIVFQVNLKKGAFLVIRSSVGVLSVFSRLSVGKIGEDIREVKETAILTNSTFCIGEFFRCSFVFLRFIIGLLCEGDRQGTKEWNLKNRYSVGCRVYGVKARISVECKGQDKKREHFG